MHKVHLRKAGALLFSVLLGLSPLTSIAHTGAVDEDGAPTAAGSTLGAISFPTTTQSATAQQAFVEGTLLLHLFEYPFAREKFQRAQKLDPGFAMAYWGEAMTYNHPIWDQQQRKQAVAALHNLGSSAEARQSKTSSQKERDYLVALDLLYADGPKAGRDLAYMQHMQEMAANYPQDNEVQLFYALSILGVSSGVRDVPAYMRSAAISQRVFYANRKHPGAAHYLIHAVDDPVHAPLGLEAARALAAMAPDAGHAQHMASHIFLAVGMWDDVVAANQSALRVVNSIAASRDRPVRHWGHYNFWLLYGLLQQGRYEQAAAFLRTAYQEVRDANVLPENPLELEPDDSQLGSVVQMWARYMIETHGKDRVMAAWKFNLNDAFDPTLNYHYVMGLDNVDQGNPTEAKNHLQAFQALKTRLQAAVLAMDRQAPTDLIYLKRLNIMELELMAKIALAEKDRDKAIEYAQQASQREGNLPVAFGPPFIDLPAAELLGQILLDNGQYAEAAAAFTLQGQRTQLKALPLLGLAHAEEARGNAQSAAHARVSLAAIWKNADAGVKAQLNPGN